MAKNDTYSIRTALRADAPAIYAVHQASFTTLCATHYPLEVLQRMFASKTVEGYYQAIDRDEMFVCESNRQTVGFGHAVPGEVVAIFVHPNAVRQGVGTALLNHAVQCARRDHAGPIKVIATLNAQPFYERRGFLEVRHYALSRGNVEFPVVEMVFPRPENDQISTI
jgi:GNAT superfamily N-acetyltransferase